MDGQAALFDPGPAEPAASEPVRPAEERTPEEWWAEYLRHRERTITGMPGRDISTEAEQRARRRFAKRHGLGREWLREYAAVDWRGGWPA
jgi:hypothetical protein